MSTKTEIPPQSPASPGSEALTWSAEKPKRRGWWWVQLPKYPDLKAIVLVFESPNKTLLVDFRQQKGCTPLKDVSGMWWLGPLPDPPDAPNVEPPLNDVSATEKL